MKVFDENIPKKVTNMWQIQNIAKYGKILPNIANVAKLIHFSILGIRFAKGKKGEFLQCFLGRNLLSLLSPIHAWSVHAGFLTHKHINGTFWDATIEPKLSWSCNLHNCSPMIYRDIFWIFMQFQVRVNSVL